MAPRWFVIVRGWTKFLAIVCGLVVSTLAVMSVVGIASSNGWVRAVVAAIVLLAVPSVASDRLLPRDPTQARGLPSDVFAVWFAGVAVAFLASDSVTRPLLLREADREASAGAGSVARVTYFLAGATPAPAKEPEAQSKPVTSSEEAPPPPAAPHDAAGPAAPAAEAGVDVPRPLRTPAELFRDLAPAVVNLSVKTAGGEGGGTGFLIDTEGTLATAHHVIAGVDELRIKLFNGKWVENSDIELLADNATEDLALLRLHSKETLKAVHLGDSELVSVGEPVISIGNPLGLEHTLTDGLVSARRMYEGHAYIQMSAPVSPGNSGGPLFNMRGEVIGVTTQQVAGGMFGRAQNLNLAVPVNVLKPMIATDYPKRHRFGKDAASTTTW